MKYTSRNFRKTCLRSCAPCVASDQTARVNDTKFLHAGKEDRCVRMSEDEFFPRFRLILPAFQLGFLLKEILSSPMGKVFPLSVVFIFKGFTYYSGGCATFCVQMCLLLSKWRQTLSREFILSLALFCVTRYIACVAFIADFTFN